MIQLKVYTDKTKTDYSYIDLYEESPIKLNFSIEDITNAEAKSIFSRTFRVPGTSENNKYFKWSFLVNATDFDVTVKKPAEILIDGNIFRQGHIRLQKIYNNSSLNRYDYELIFLGETRDFSSALADSSLCSLDLTALNHILTFDNVTDSWLAYPTARDYLGITYVSDATSGLVDGNVIYPLVDFGNEGEITNDNIRIALHGEHNFTNNALPLNRLKPMVRAKAVIDAIFDATEYSYEPGGFFDSELFRQVYVSGWGNTSSNELNTAGSNNICQATLVGEDSGAGPMEFNTEITDPGNNFTLSTGVYEVPATFGGVYEFYAETNWFGDIDSQGQSIGTIELQKKAAGTSTWTTLQTGGSDNSGIITVSWTGSLNDGDQIRGFVDEAGPSGGRCQNNLFQCLAAPGLVNVAAQFDCDYKQIDFIKDILTTFRLVMAPRRDKPTEFIIEPWVDYVATGDVYDWSLKLDKSKDIVLQPLFDTQQDIIYFDHKEDKDYINEYHVNAYKDVYGHLEFDSGNELLTGNREIKTTWAPTPQKQIEGAATSSSFIIPQIHTHNDAGEHLPIKPKTRLLFYNGVYSTAGDSYRLEGGPNAINYYPVITNSSTWPMTSNGTVLNWFNDIGYWGNGVAGYPTQLGQSLYQKYWGTYIQSLYNKFARRMTATFILDSQDLLDFSFDDVIFVEGQYWRPEKVIDAPVGTRSQVKVQLIKLLNYRGPGIPVGGEGLDPTPTPTPIPIEPTPTPTPAPTIDGGGNPLPTPTPTPTPTFDGGGGGPES